MWISDPTSVVDDDESLINDKHHLTLPAHIPSPALAKTHNKKGNVSHFKRKNINNYTTGMENKCDIPKHTKARQSTHLHMNILYFIKYIMGQIGIIRNIKSAMSPI